MSAAQSNLNSASDSGQNWQEIVRQHVESLRFGTVEIIVHDSRVIQIEKTERVRLGKTGVGADTVRIELNAEDRSPKK
ncbi:MAG: YezD family protein [Verrucomicrobiota bacterium]